MRKIDVIVHFKNYSTLARHLNISRGAVAKWSPVIPEKRARQLAMEMPDKFNFDSELYKRKAS